MNHPNCVALLPLIVYILTLVTFTSTGPAPFSLCKLPLSFNKSILNQFDIICILGNVSNTVLQSNSTQVDVSDCSSENARCPLYIGGAHNITIKFGKKATDSIFVSFILFFYDQLY